MTRQGGQVTRRDAIWKRRKKVVYGKRNVWHCKEWQRCKRIVVKEQLDVHRRYKSKYLQAW
jgi:succinate dehydrogenase/fumarate reductase-like Fe-S protein